jgi:hypothetical protein
MNVRGPFASQVSPLGLGCLVAILVGLFAPGAARAQSGAPPGDFTFTKDIAPILQRSCHSVIGRTASLRCRLSRTKRSDPGPVP